MDIIYTHLLAYDHQETKVRLLGCWPVTATRMRFWRPFCRDRHLNSESTQCVQFTMLRRHVRSAILRSWSIFRKMLRKPRWWRHVRNHRVNLGTGGSGKKSTSNGEQGWCMTRSHTVFKRFLWGSLTPRGCTLHKSATRGFLKKSQHPAPAVQAAMSPGSPAQSQKSRGHAPSRY